MVEFTSQSFVRTSLKLGSVLGKYDPGRASRQGWCDRVYEKYLQRDSFVYTSCMHRLSSIIVLIRKKGLGLLKIGGR